MKAVPQPQLRSKPPEHLPPLALIHFRGGEAEWLKLNSDLPKLIDCRTVQDLEQGFTQRLYRLMDFLFVLIHQQQDWRIIAAYLHFCDENGQFLPERTVDQNGRIKRQGGGMWAGLTGGKNTTTKKDNTDLVGRYLTRTSRETADETIATYLGMTQEEKERELRRILVSMDLILEVAEKKRCWRAAVQYLKMVDYDGSFLPMTSAARDRWEKTYARHVDKWEQVEKRRAEKAAKTTKTTAPPSPASGKRAAVVVNCVDTSGEQEAQPRATEACPSPTAAAAEVAAVVPNTPDDNSRERAEALAAQRRAHQDKLNAAIPGRACRGKKKKKPGALTPRPNSATYNAKGQLVAKGKVRGQKPKAFPPQPATIQKSELSKLTDHQVDITESRNEWGKDPP
jgi:hypothetical protein